MPVEKRYSKRYPMDGDVYIRYRKQRLFPAKAVNCSVQGIFLRTESLTMLTGALVELEIYRGGRQWSIMGVVTHTQHDGVGVMFWKPQSELYESVIAEASNLGRIATVPQSTPVDVHP
ncbi:MAG: PilZ domain-containing protein [Chromatiales bacterium]|nr:PilZ domain-containing protein [Chromatiales bacterium]